MWSFQKCNVEWDFLISQIDWRSTWLYFNHNQKTTHNFINFKLNYFKSFKIKILLNELPTYFYFHKIYPHIFHNNNCFYCSLPDSLTHWCLCSIYYLSLILFKLVHLNILKKLTWIYLKTNKKSLFT